MKLKRLTLKRSPIQMGLVAWSSTKTDRETGQARGFGFVEMSDNAQADKAIGALNGAELDGRALTVNEARPKEDRGGGGGRGNSGGGFVTMTCF